jgi:hypothetical protein
MCAQVFVAAIGASSYTFACATVDQSMWSRLDALARALTFYGGCPQLIIPDNPRALVSEACRYESKLDRTVREFARHYDVSFLPTRQPLPKDSLRQGPPPRANYSPGSPFGHHPVPKSRANGHGRAIRQGHHDGNVKKTVMPSVAFGVSVVSNGTGTRAPCRVAWIDPAPALTLNNETTYSCAPALVWVTPAAARRVLVPQIERENLATPPYVTFGWP